jgi:hypothetical protein
MVTSSEFTDDPEMELETAEQAASSVDRFRNSRYSKCIESNELPWTNENPLGMATCTNSQTQRLEAVYKKSFVLNGRRYALNWLRFAGTNKCLYANGDKEVIKKDCGSSNKFLWSRGNFDDGRHRFVNRKHSKCLKVGGSQNLKVGNCDGSEHKWYLE